jgi:serine/alanine adding enzyme
VTRVIDHVTDTSAAWRQTVDGLAETSLAHSAEWFTIIRRAYGHQPLYLSALDNDGRTGVLPAFVVRRPLFGTVVTSMPFLDSGGPRSDSAPLTQLLVERLVADARAIGARSVELRCSQRLDVAVRPAEHKVNMTLRLATDPDRLWRQLDKTVRNQIRKAERSGLSLQVGGAENVPAFYEPFVVRMRELGSPVHSVLFLRCVIDAFKGRARLVLVRKHDTVVGGLLALAFKDRVVVPWAACRREYFSLCPNMLLYWETIRTACTDGFRFFDFGRSSRDSGTYRFKWQWGAREEPLYWYTIPLSPRRTTIAPQSSAHGREALLGKAWRHLPLVVTRHLGPHIRKYLIQ